MACVAQLAPLVWILEPSYQLRLKRAPATPAANGGRAALSPC